MAHHLIRSLRMRKAEPPIASILPRLHGDNLLFVIDFTEKRKLSKRRAHSTVFAASVCGRLIAGITGSNPSGRAD
jgi:hypothetical protein